jgi:hypothetical protein
MGALGWGLLNSKGKGLQPPGNIGGIEVEATGKYSKGGTTRITWQSSGAKAGTVNFDQCLPDQPQPVEDVSGSTEAYAFCGIEKGRSGSASQCGPNNWAMGIKERNGYLDGWPCTDSGRNMTIARTGFNGFIYQLPRVTFTFTPLSPNITDGDASDLIPQPAPIPPLPLPNLPFPEPFPEPLPEREPQPLPEPLPVPEPLPDVPPLPLPDPGEDPAPTPAPGPGPAPQPVPLPAPSTPTAPRPQPEDPQIGTDGQVVPKPQPPPVVTPPGVEQTPDGPIGQPGTKPPATPEGIAEWVGKIEQKAMKLLERKPTGFSTEDLIAALEEWLANPTYQYPSGSYLLYPPCAEKSDGQPGPPKEASWPGGSGELAEVVARVDALAELIQHHKDVRQPICHVRATGQQLTVDFIEDRPGTWEDRPLRKTLSYRDQGGGSLESHTAGWEGFSWEAGPVKRISKGEWGEVKVYASSAAEAERVIRHAAGLAGYDMDNDPNHRWFTGVHSGGRIGRTGTMVVKPVAQGIAVRWRDGPSGPSYTATTNPNV